MEIQTIKTATPKTVRSRTLTSDGFAVFSEIMQQAGITDSETRRVFLALIDMGRRAEEQAEKKGVSPSAHRRHHTPAWLAELYYRRGVLPINLSRDERKRREASLSRAWRRRWALVHDAQCRSHLPFAVKEDGEIADSRKHRPAASYTDNLTDLIADGVRRFRRMPKRGLSIIKVRQAVVDVLREFRAAVEPYAPDWTEPEEETTALGATADESEAGSFWETVESRTARFARKMLREGREQGEHPDAIRAALHAYVETVFSEHDDPNDDGPGGKETNRTVPPVSKRADTSKTRAAAAAQNAPFSASSLSLVATNTEEKEEMKPDHADKSVLMPRASSPVMDARQTMDALTSVGSSKFKIVFLDMKPLNGQSNCKGADEVDAATAKRLAASYIARSEGRRESVCIRTQKGYGSLIQVDDCDEQTKDRLAPVSFLIIETSPGSFQCWLALPLDTPDRQRVSVRERLLERLKGTGANGGAYNSLRVPGSLNAKQKYLTADGHLPRVRLIQNEEGRFTSAEELECAGLLAAPKVKPIQSTPYVSTNIPGAWPDYQHYLNQAPKSSHNESDRSNADICFAMVALREGFMLSEVAGEIERLSSKAKGRRDGYGMKTARAAARYLAEDSSRATGTYGARVRFQI